MAAGNGGRNDMRYVALAAGFDGTLARDGHCDERCIEALRALAATGRKLILVTGRELRELLEIFPEARLFDYVVAENGAVMHRPATRAIRDPGAGAAGDPRCRSCDAGTSRRSRSAARS